MSVNNFGFLGGGGPTTRVKRRPRVVAQKQENEEDSKLQYQQKTWQGATMVVTPPVKVPSYPTMGANTKPVTAVSNPAALKAAKPLINAALPPDMQEKLEKWRAKRSQQQPQPSKQLHSNHAHDHSHGGHDHSHGGNHGGHDHSHNEPDEPDEEEEVEAEEEVQVQPPPIMRRQEQPVENSNTSSIFHPSNQEIIKGIIASEVRATLDKLKTERRELVDQESALNQFSLRTLKVEENLQEFNIREQRLRDAVEKLEISIKATQTNVDEIKKDSNSAFVTEDVMRSWVKHFYNEQAEELRLKVADEIKKGVAAAQKPQEELEKLIVAAVNKKTIELSQSIADVDRKFENTLQKIYTSTCFTIARAVNHVNVYENSDEKSRVLWDIKENQRVVLYYPLNIVGDRTIWIKTRRVNPDDAELSEGWVPIMLNGTVNLGDFGLNF